MNKIAKLSLSGKSLPSSELNCKSAGSGEGVTEKCKTSNRSGYGKVCNFTKKNHLLQNTWEILRVFSHHSLQICIPKRDQSRLHYNGYSNMTSSPYLTICENPLIFRLLMNTCSSIYLNRCCVS